MNLITISTNTSWGNSAADLNENFSRANIEIEKLKLATVSFKGYFADSSSLTAAVPLPVPGDYAWAGTPFPGTVYQCQTAGTWTNTGTAPDMPGVDLNNWNQTNW